MKKQTPVQKLDAMHERMMLPKDIPYHVTRAFLRVAMLLSRLFKKKGVRRDE